MQPRDRVVLARLIDPIDQASHDWGQQASKARIRVLMEVHRRQRPYWAWDQHEWLALTGTKSSAKQEARLHLVALGMRLGGHRRLHHHAGVQRLSVLGELVFGPGRGDPALTEVRDTLRSWGVNSADTLGHQINCAVWDLLLTCDTVDLHQIDEARLAELAAQYPVSSRRRGLIKISRVLAHKGLISRPLQNVDQQRGTRPETLTTVPAEWLELVERWRALTTCEPSTLKTKFPMVLIAGRWAADKHPDAIAPAAWTRDMAAEYVADTMSATIGQWAGHNRNTSRLGEPLSITGKAHRIDCLRSFFSELIDWEWITPNFDPRKVLSLPTSARAQIVPNPRIIDDASWAKLMAAGLTLNSEDLKPYGTPRAKDVGYQANYYPIEMVRAMVGVWLFAGCRVDEIRRLELDCIIWDEGHDEQTGETYRVCLLRVPANKTSAAFTKPVDPVVGQLIEAWKLVRAPQPDITDRKTRQRRQHLFTHRGQLVGGGYLNDHVIPALCTKAGIPMHDSRGALTSHRARATIATQLLNARDPLTLADLQQWLGHKHPSSTRHYAAILQRTLTAAYKKADYFARNVRTIEVLIDRDTIRSGAAADGQPWKYYDLGDGYCTYDFFAKCPHRLACARCPFYLPKQSHAGQLLAVKDGIEGMLEQLDLTDEERQALQGDRDAVAALAERLADTPTPAGPTPNQLGHDRAFISLTALRDSLTGGTA
ncbi:tyrosine-type recombinase/integrase [Actinomadura montaniterrae]|uniref:Tyrosine-type recombinase/integrase n=1 Tax=Actinomadura montaniterrae TaxID=1803903 RepID=A0A6L3W528_9ACTN|nr:tyrosine-type recombinase/integrase [Actinomadura montaniterrae]